MVILASPKTLAHSRNTRFVVTNHRRLLVEAREQVEQEIAAIARDRQVAELVKNHEVSPAHGIGEASLASVVMLAFEHVGEFDDIEEAAAGPVADAAARDRHREMRLPGPGSADQECSCAVPR